MSFAVIILVILASFYVSGDDFKLQQNDIEDLEWGGHGLRPDMYPHRDEWKKYIKTPLPFTWLSLESIPKEFSWRSAGDDGLPMTTGILNQHIPRYCGSCWLHGAIGALNDRIKIMKRGKGEEVRLGRQVVLNCGLSNGANAGSCKGGTDLGVYDYARRFGIPDETCQTYEAREHECSDFRICMNCDCTPEGKLGLDSEKGCFPVQRYAKYYVSEWGAYNFETGMFKEAVHQIKSEVFLRGPVTCSIDSSLLEYGKYVPGHILRAYERSDGKPWSFNHVIVVSGWGVEKDENTGEEIPYWVARNSWGSFWGEDGWFRVEMGKNVTGIETVCGWAVPTEPIVDDYGPSDIKHMFPSGVDAYMETFTKRMNITSIPTDIFS